MLCISDDPDLRADLLVLCQEVGARATTAAPELTTWTSAVLVLLDDRCVARVQHLPRRDGVVLVHAAVTGDEPGPAVWRRAVAARAAHVAVLPTARGWLGAAVRQAGRPRARCVATVGARGGGGASSTAVALATTAAAAGRRVLLLDADPMGGGLDLALGAEELPGMRWSDLRDLRGPLPPGGLAASLPVADGVAVLSHGREATTVASDVVGVVMQAALDEHDLVVVDLPRAGDEGAGAAASAADALVCVCPAEVRAGAGAPAVLRRWAMGAQLHLLVRGPSPGGLRAADAAEAVRAGCALVGGWPSVRSGAAAGAVGAELHRVDLVRAEPGLAAALERGEPFASGARSPLRRWAAGWLADFMPGGARAAA